MGTGGRNRDGWVTTRGMERAAQETPEATMETAMEASRRRQTTEDPLACRTESGAGRKYHAGGRGIEDRSDVSAKWSGEETEELASEEEADTAVWGWGVRMAADSNGTGIRGKQSGSHTRGRSGKGGGATADATNDATSEDTATAGAEGRHGAGRRETARVAVRRENPASKSS